MWHTDVSVENWKPMAWCYVKNTLQCPPLVLFVGFLGVRNSWKEPDRTAGHWAKQLGAHRMHSCPMQGLLLLTMTRSITAGSRIVWLSPAPYKASIHRSFVPPDSATWLEVKLEKKRTEQDRHFPPDRIPASDKSPSHVWKRRRNCAGRGLERFSHQNTHVCSPASRRGLSVAVCPWSAPGMNAAGSWKEKPASSSEC